jgi:potassium-transporting ATPase ATP-binding subunit
MADNYKRKFTNNPSKGALEMATTLKPAQDVSEVTTPPSRFRKFARRSALLAPGTFGPALKQAFVMLRPDVQWKNPVMFVVEIGAFLTLFYLVQAALGKSESQVSIGYFVALDIGLFLMVRLLIDLLDCE